MGEFEQVSIGKSVKGIEIPAYKVSRGPRPFLLIGGVHGDEPEGFFLVESFLNQKNVSKKFPGIDLWVIPRLNVDGCSEKNRTNANGVDLNRNMPTKDWTQVARAPRYFPGESPNSEPETQSLIEFIEKIKPKAILSAHSWEPMINYNGPAQKWAEHMAQFNKYKTADDIGYPTPGSLGTWAGWERKIPTITLEIERDSAPEKILKTHLEALNQALVYFETAPEFAT